MKNIETEITINAKPDKVWNTLMKTDEYHKWNPFVRKLEGEIKKGNQIAITLKQVNGKEMDFKPVITELAPQKELRWQGKLFISGIFDGEHYFMLEPIEGNKTKFIHGENFSGILIPFMGGVLKSTEEGFKAMNEELKTRCEQE
ncbi:MAG: SRPBCC family protein [Chlorobiota bacterium]